MKAQEEGVVLPKIDAEKVAEAPWSVAEWAVALRFDNLRATVLLRALGWQLPTSFEVRNALFTLEDHQNILKV